MSPPAFAREPSPPARRTLEGLITISQYSRMTGAQQDRYDRRVCLALIESKRGRAARNRAALRTLAEVITLATGAENPGVGRTRLMKLYAGAEVEQGGPKRLC